MIIYDRKNQSQMATFSCWSESEREVKNLIYFAYSLRCELDLMHHKSMWSSYYYLNSFNIYYNAKCNLIISHILSLGSLANHQQHDSTPFIFQSQAILKIMLPCNYYFHNFRQLTELLLLRWYCSISISYFFSFYFFSLFSFHSLSFLLLNLIE
jgi:hypothetical protein